MLDKGAAARGSTRGARSGPVKSLGPLKGRRGANSTPQEEQISSSARDQVVSGAASSTRRARIGRGFSVSFASLTIFLKALRRAVVALLKDTCPTSGSAVSCFK